MTLVKVARISHVPFFLVTQLHAQIKEIRKTGMDVTLISSEGEILKRIKFDEFLHHVPIYMHRNIHLWHDVVCLFRLYQLFKREKFQIIHSTTPKGGLLTSMAGRLAGVPIRLHTFTGQVWVDMKGWKRIICKVCDKIILSLNTQNYADSLSQVEFLKKEKLIKETSKLKVLGKGSLAGVDMARFAPSLYGNEAKAIKEELGIRQSSKVIIFIGRVTKDKGIEELVAAFKRLKDADTRLIIVGPLEEDKQLLSRETLNDIFNHDHIHYVGEKPNPEHYLAASDLLCLPSYREGFGTVVIEAAAMGLPTVGTRVYGLVDSIIDGETGLLVSMKNVDELVHALDLILENDLLRQELGERARTRVQKFYDESIVSSLVISEYRNFYQQMKYPKGIRE